MCDRSAARTSHRLQQASSVLARERVPEQRRGAEIELSVSPVLLSHKGTGAIEDGYSLACEGTGRPPSIGGSVVPGKDRTGLSAKHAWG